MSIDITMPRLSDTMQSGTINKWNVSEGDTVSAGDVVADIETDKAAMEMQVYDDGTIAKILVSEGEQVDVGTLIAVLAEEDEDPAEVAKSIGSRAAAKSEEQKNAPSGDDAEATNDESDAEEEMKTEKKSSPSRAAAEESSKQASSGGEGSGDSGGSGSTGGGAEVAVKESNGRLRVSPVARRLADDHGVDVTRLKGSGPSGRIIKRDVLEAVEAGGAGEADSGQVDQTSPAPSMTKPAGRTLQPGDVKLNNMRQTIARRLIESKTTIPHYQVTMSFNMDPLMELRSTLNEQLASQGVKLSVNDFLIRACALAIHQHPEFNASWGGDKLTIHEHVNVGMAISLPAEKGGGLVVGVIRNADRAGLRQIAAEARRLAGKAREKGLTIEEMSDSTFTLSNLGMYGVEHFTAIINPPNSAILAVGGAIEKPVVRDGQIVIGHEMQATLSLDHRIIDGAMAAEYLQTLKQLIEHPATLLV